MMLLATGIFVLLTAAGIANFDSRSLVALVVVLVAAAIGGRRVQLEALQPRLIRLGYKASAEQFGPAKLRDFAIAAEANGFDSVFVSDTFSRGAIPTAMRHSRLRGSQRSGNERHA